MIEEKEVSSMRIYKDRIYWINNITMFDVSTKVSWKQ